MDTEVIGEFNPSAREQLDENTQEGDSVEVPFIVSRVQEEVKIIDVFGNPL